MKNKNNQKQPQHPVAESIFDMQIEAGVVECGRVGISFERTFAVLLIRLGDDIPASEVLLAQRREKAHKLWQQGVDTGNAQVAEKLRKRFDTDLTGSYTDMTAHRRDQAVDDEIAEQFGGDET